MEDKTITCVQCNSQFTLTADEQKFFADKGFVEPKRCKDCRRKNKIEKEQRGGY